MDQFLVNAQQALEVGGLGIAGGHQSQDAGVSPAPDPPHMQIADDGRPRACGNDLMDFQEHRRVHLRVRKHFAGVPQQATHRDAVNGLVSEVLEGHPREHLGEPMPDAKTRAEETDAIAAMLKSCLR